MTGDDTPAGPRDRGTAEPDGAPVSSEQPSGRVPTLAERLDRCFRTMHSPDRGDWTYREVAQGVAEIDPDGACSISYIYNLRTGRRTNPTLRQLAALAQFFHVPVSYFVGSDDEVQQTDAEVELLQAMRTPGVRDLALRASSLSPASMRAVAAIVTELGALGKGAGGAEHRPREPDGSGDGDTRSSDRGGPTS